MYVPRGEAKDEAIRLGKSVRINDRIIALRRGVQLCQDFLSKRLRDLRSAVGGELFWIWLCRFGYLKNSAPL